MLLATLQSVCLPDCAESIQDKYDKVNGTLQFYMDLYVPGVR